MGIMNCVVKTKEQREWEDFQRRIEAERELGYALAEMDKGNWKPVEDLLERYKNED